MANTILFNLLPSRFAADYLMLNFIIYLDLRKCHTNWVTIKIKLELKSQFCRKVKAYVWCYIIQNALSQHFSCIAKITSKMVKMQKEKNIYIIP